MDEEVKTCTKCNETKGLSEFYKKKGGKFGVSGHCKVCTSKHMKNYYQENKEAILEYHKNYHQENKETLLDYSRNYYQENKKVISGRMKNYYQENKEVFKNYRKENKEVLKNYRKENRALYNATEAKRRSLKLRATPEWLTEEQDLEIKAYYKKAKALEKKDGIQRHVDHIVPLKGKNICGLHVPWNLQVLTAEENLRKSNSYPYHI